ncbi:MAG: diguanylate cyclase, partial [Chloroflexi bacterium]|nr:diguanylate cyclase [Chloroflexota bacterium]
DTFALWLLVRRQRALARLHPLAIAIATRYGTLASRLAGLVAGVRHPFEGLPLVSANAHLGVALWALDYRPSLLPGLVAFVRARRRPNGGFGEEGQPADALTTLAAGDLLATLDPDFDPGITAAFLATAQEPGGWWRALDPETPWLTGAIVEWLEAAGKPFAQRFHWPEHQRLDLDRKTGVPGFGAFDRIARVFDALPGLAGARVELAFSDLVRFREFNNRFGQEMGDRVLRAFAAALSDVGAALPIRDGGDEFMVVGAPTRTGLLDDLLELCQAWPARFSAEFGSDVPAVAPRFVVATTTGRDLSQTREQLGRAIPRLKELHPEPGPTGIIRPL